LKLFFILKTVLHTRARARAHTHTHTHTTCTAKYIYYLLWNTILRIRILETVY